MTSTLGLALAAMRLGVSFFSAVLGWLGVSSPGKRHVGQCALREPPGRTANCAQSQSRADGVGELGAGVMGKMISVQRHRCGGRRDRNDEGGTRQTVRFTIKHSIFLMAVMASCRCSLRMCSPLRAGGAAR